MTIPWSLQLSKRIPSDGVRAVTSIGNARLTDLDEEGGDIAPHEHVLHKTRWNRRVDGCRATLGSICQAPIDGHNKMAIDEIVESQECSRADNDEYLHRDEQAGATLMCANHDAKEETN